MNEMAGLETELGHLHHALVWSEEHAQEYFMRPYIWASLGDAEKALHEITDRPAAPCTGTQKLWCDKATFFFKRDYQGFRDWTLSDDVRAALLAYDPRVLCSNDFQATFFLRDWEAAVSAIDECDEVTSPERMEMIRGTAAGRVQGRGLDAAKQMELVLTIALR